MSWLNLAALPLIARIFLVVLFPFSALDKIIYWDDALKQARSSFIPGGAVLVILAIVIEVVTPLCIVLSWHDRLAAFVLTGFCVVTAVLYHPFWSYPDFWTPGDSKGRNNFWDFLKNLGLAGGLILIVIVTGFSPATAVIKQPLSSSPQMAPAPANPAAPEIKTIRSTP